MYVRLLPRIKADKGKKQGQPPSGGPFWGLFSDPPPLVSVVFGDPLRGSHINVMVCEATPSF